MLINPYGHILDCVHWAIILVLLTWVLACHCRGKTSHPFHYSSVYVTLDRYIIIKCSESISLSGFFYCNIQHTYNKTEGFIKTIRCIPELLKWSYSGIIVLVILELVDEQFLIWNKHALIIYNPKYVVIYVIKYTSWIGEIGFWEVNWITARLQNTD